MQTVNHALTTTCRAMTSATKTELNLPVEGGAAVSKSDQTVVRDPLAPGRYAGWRRAAFKTLNAVARSEALTRLVVGSLKALGGNVAMANVLAGELSTYQSKAGYHAPIPVSQLSGLGQALMEAALNFRASATVTSQHVTNPDDVANGAPPRLLRASGNFYGIHRDPNSGASFAILGAGSHVARRTITEFSIDEAHPQGPLRVAVGEPYISDREGDWTVYMVPLQDLDGATQSRLQDIRPTQWSKKTVAELDMHAPHSPSFVLGRGGDIRGRYPNPDHFNAAARAAWDAVDIDKVDRTAVVGVAPLITRTPVTSRDMDGLRLKDDAQGPPTLQEGAEDLAAIFAQGSLSAPGSSGMKYVMLDGDRYKQAGSHYSRGITGDDARAQARAATDNPLVATGLVTSSVVSGSDQRELGLDPRGGQPRFAMTATGGLYRGAIATVNRDVVDDDPHRGAFLSFLGLR